MKHTTGPWQVETDTTNIITSTGDYVAVVYLHGTEETKANARLIAAAPELLDALRDLTARVDRGEMTDGSSLDTSWATALLARIEEGN
jgi:hypothetical protein